MLPLPSEQRTYVSPGEVLYLLKSLNVRKASGPDGVSTYMLKATAESIAPSLAKVFSLSLLSGKFPSLWKSARVVPIHKSGSKSDASNYRPKSLLSVVSKLLEKYVYSLLWEHLVNHAPLSECQWGFQAGKSTVALLLAATHDWQKVIDQGGSVMSVFFDIQKAFDSVPHQRLLKRLVELNLHPLLLSWLCSYLGCRSQHVVVNGACSSTVNVLSGVPQGSVLGPLLFLIYIDTISSIELSSGTKILLYADDILVYKPIVNNFSFCELQQDIDMISEWSKANYLKFSVPKCKCMLLTHKRNTHSPTMELDGVSLELVTQYKYLGITISSNLHWAPHINRICSNARKYLGLIYRNFATNISNPTTFLCLYLALVRPSLEYASQVWDPYLLKDIRKIENVQKFALRICSGRYQEPYENLLDAFQVPTLTNRRLYLSLCTLFNIVKERLFLPQFQLTTLSKPHIRYHHSHMLKVPFAHTECLRSSFLHKTVRLWNYLPTEAVASLDLHSFKVNILPIFS